MNRHPRHRDHQAPNAPRWTQERPQASERLERLRVRYPVDEKAAAAELDPALEMRPQFKEDLELWLQEFVTGDGSISESALIPILQKTQGLLGYLPQWAMADIGDRLRVPYSSVYGAATFYAQFRLEPQGKNVIKVCMGTACHVRGGALILAALKEQLGIGPGETTPDLEFSMERVACLGACGLAPVVVVNGEAHGRMTPTAAKELVDTVRSEDSEDTAS